MKTEKFSIGEVAVINNPGSANHGKEVTILSDEAYGTLFSTWKNEMQGPLYYYIVDDVNLESGPYSKGNRPTGIQTKLLRKKKPPRDDLKKVTWDECPWKPASIKA